MIEPGTYAFWRATLALCLGSFLVFANLYITQPLMPLFSARFGISALQATWSLSICTLSLGLSLLLYGPLSDALGRRKIMIVSLLGAVLVPFLIARVESYGALLGWRVVQGFFLGGLPAIAIAYLGDEFNRKALLMAVGFYISGNSLGGIGGRLAGGWLTDRVDWPFAFQALAAASLVAVVLFIWLLPPSRHFQPRPLRPATMLRDLGGHLRNPLLLAAYAVGGLNFFIFANQYSFITYVLSEAPYSLPPTWLGMLFLTYLSGTLGSALSGRVAQQLPQSLCMLLGILILMSGSLVTLIDSLPAIIGGLLINSFGFFFCHSMASSWINRHAQGARASASSLYLVFYYLGASAGGIYLNLFWLPWGWSGVVGGSLAVLMVTATLALWLYRQETSGEPVTL
ncbi:MFS transporter [Motiliproteus sp. SC1-56]|uniref:MFS transporter n=1 Tax=Motiliproteus sp. SC1-56 TaxID=2799565 RepID=UPI001A8E039B|nr:MFS transporter [Motiliproteus sp. SC1-56]